jgi:phosphonate transport system ATP-binding protein
LKVEESCLIEVQNLSLRIGERWLVRDLSFSTNKGEFIALVGSSGSGKTTLLRALSGDTPVSNGQVLIHTNSPLPVGMIHQDLQLAEGSTAIKNALSGCLYRHSSLQTFFGFPEEEKSKAITLLQKLGLGQKLNQWTSTLSRGERQRLAIARTLLAQPSILLADEPVASLDGKWAEETLNILKEYAKDQQACVVCSLHDLDQVDQFADTIIQVDPVNHDKWEVKCNPSTKA